MALNGARLEDPAATVRHEGADIEARTCFFKGQLYLQLLERRSRKCLELAKAATGAERLGWLQKVKTNATSSAATRAKTVCLLTLFDTTVSVEQRIEFAISDRSSRSDDQ